jgi:hypothetical protein
MRFFLQSLKNDATAPDDEEEVREKLSTLMNENCHSSNCYKCYIHSAYIVMETKKLSFQFCGKDLFPVHSFLFHPIYCGYIFGVIHK